jgi:hypothetical protein
MRTWIPILLLGCLAACASDAPGAPSGPVNTQIVLAPGQTSDVVANAGIRLRFAGVIGDSRCPGDAICIQGGDAIVRVDVLPTGGGQATFDLHTGNLQPAQFGDLTIALVQLMPYPFSSLPPIGPNDYRATLRVTRN